ncbi:glutamate 5-kinase [Haliscomenobacter sp.]|uniref:glutamate 5-kinase n=1 Tax=Haliscomenobacter sp. TaxID=2717303 RepID=UPI003BAAD051
MSTVSYHRIVVKIGSNVLTDEQSRPDEQRIAHLVEQVAWLRSQGAEVILVSSGAVAMGRSTLPQLSHVNPVLRRQVWASVGQPRLMQIYQHLFAEKGTHIAQLLVTKEDFRDREHYLNMKACLQGLLRDEIVPIINENDAVAVTELMFTDNDELAGLVAAAVNADVLVILSNVAGIYDGHPSDPNSRLIREIDPNDGQFQRFILPSTSSFGRGGMNTKYRIARKAAVLGVHTIIANGKKDQILHDIWEQTGEYTLFPSQKKTSNLKKRLAYQGAEPKGKIIINDGAALALRAEERVSSLLPVGVTAIEGDFERGDIVAIFCGAEELGIGMAQYGSATARKYVGQKGKKALVHYDYLLIG